MASRAFHEEPLDALLGTIPSLPRPLLSRLITGLIERLDEIDGDADLEEVDAEDSFALSPWALQASGPGCAISEPDYEHDGCEEEDGI